MSNPSHQPNNNSVEEEKKKEIDLKELFSILKKRIWIVVLITAIFTILSAFYNNLTYSPLYQSSSRMLVKAPPELMKTLTVMMKEPIILGKVVEELKLNRSPEQLSSQISVNSIEGSQILTISVIDSNGPLTAKIANATAEAYKSEIPKLIDFNDFEVLSTANEQRSWYPINDTSKRNNIGAFIFGLIISIGLVFFLHSLDDTIKSEREIEKLLGVSVIGSVPKANKRLLGKKKNQKNVTLRGESVGS
ncbi:YveK family protein [Pseudalkalibacillus caeni]|uniref:YveK family protein n=1 Tax=Exobacillus caeni TaxID=2574798 RepID=UPI0014857756|nr:Wzz/FepE/Etk N-terminal domain-containing protein [Pseudalkalibacillus caeni]